MSIPTRLYNYLDQHGIRYQLCMHEHSRTSAETARTAHIDPRQLAKPVLLEDETGYVMAVVPGDRRVMLGELSRMLGRNHLRLVDESRIARMFEGCDAGAMPPVGMAWGMETVVDETLEAMDCVYMEGGDHERLLQLSHDQFHELMRGQMHGHFCRPMIH